MKLFANLNEAVMIKTVGICPNFSKCMQLMKWLYIIQIGMKVFEVTQN